MPKSMTGYGRGARAAAGFAVTVEARSTNHRFRDMTVRMPRELSGLEDSVRELVAASVSRGHVEVTVTLEETSPRPRTVEVRGEVACAYHRAAVELATKLGLKDELGVGALLALPEVVSVRTVELDPASVREALEGAANDAVQAMVEMRAAEGARLAEDVIHRTNRIEQLIAGVAERAEAVIGEYRAKLEARLRELLAGVPIDEERIAMEAAVYADRISTAEEITRLRSHCRQMCAAVAGEEPVGRRLEFITQEMHREVNTIGAKSQDVEISRMVVEMKSELEKIREQVQNIE